MANQFLSRETMFLLMTFYSFALTFTQVQKCSCPICHIFSSVHYFMGFYRDTFQWTAAEVQRKIHGWCWELSLFILVTFLNLVAVWSLLHLILSCLLCLGTIWGIRVLNPGARTWSCPHGWNKEATTGSSFHLTNTHSTNIIPTSTNSWKPMNI